jgi:hypothetical protein
MRSFRITVAMAFAFACGRTPLSPAKTVVFPSAAPRRSNTEMVEAGAKKAAPGTTLWQRSYEGLGRQYLYGAAVQPAAGRIVTIGAFQGTASVGPTKLSALPGADWTLFEAWLDAGGNSLSAVVLGRADHVARIRVATARDGDTVLVGEVQEGLDVGSGPMHRTGGHGFFVTRLNADGAPRWLRRFDSPDYLWCSSVAVDADGAIAVAGSYQGTIDLGTGALPTVQSYEGFVAKLGPAGTTRWSERLIGRRTDPSALAFDRGGNLLVAGDFDEMDLGLGRLPGPRNGGDRAAFAAKLDRSGVALWNRSFVGAYDANAIAVDGSGNPTLVGIFQRDLLWDGGRMQGEGMNNGYVIALDATGATRWTKNLGTGGRGLLKADVVVVDDDGDVLVGGERNDDTFAYRVRFVAGFDAQGPSRWNLNPADGLPVGTSEGAVVLAGCGDEGHTHVAAITP